MLNSAEYVFNSTTDFYDFIHSIKEISEKNFNAWLNTVPDIFR